MTLKNIILLGATGSIGNSTLKLIRQKRDEFNLIGISAYSNVDQLKMIANEFGVKNICYFKNNFLCTLKWSCFLERGFQQAAVDEFVR